MKHSFEDEVQPQEKTFPEVVKGTGTQTLAKVRATPRVKKETGEEQTGPAGRYSHGTVGVCTPAFLPLGHAPFQNVHLYGEHRDVATGNGLKPCFK